MSVFVTGTGTGVGKTVACAALMRHFADVPALRYWKPVQTGNPPDDDAAFVARLAGVPSDRILPNLYCFSEPRSPHYAAEVAGSVVSFERLCAEHEALDRLGPLLVEGAGGVCVPLDRTCTWLDFLQTTGSPAVLVASTALGTINHSLLSLAALRNAGVRVLGVLFCGKYDEDNVRTVAEMGEVAVLGCFYFDAERDTGASWGRPDLDPQGLIAAALTGPGGSTLRERV